MKSITPEELELHHADCMLFFHETAIRTFAESSVVMSEHNTEMLKCCLWNRWQSDLLKGIEPKGPEGVAFCDDEPPPERN